MFSHFIVCIDLTFPNNIISSCILTLAEETQNGDPEEYIFSYIHPEKYPDDGSEDGLREAYNEIDIGNITQNITNEEYNFTFYNW